MAASADEKGFWFY